jgi:hypothetical protein
MLVVGAGCVPVLVASGRSWPTRLLYLPVVRPSGRWFDLAVTPLDAVRGQYTLCGLPGFPKLYADAMLNP